MPEDFAREFLAGSVAGIVSDATTHPIDTVRANLQYQRGFANLKYGSARAAFASLLRERGLYRGFLSVAVTTVPAHGLYFTGFEWGSRWYLRHRPGEDFRAHLFGGLVADVAGSLVWVPADVVKQRVQLSADKSTVHAAEGGGTASVSQGRDGAHVLDRAVVRNRHGDVRAMQDRLGDRLKAQNC